MVEIGAKLEELQMSSYDISNMSYFSIFCQLKVYARKTARETYAAFDLSRSIVKAWWDVCQTAELHSQHIPAILQKISSTRQMAIPLSQTVSVIRQKMDNG